MKCILSLLLFSFVIFSGGTAQDANNQTKDEDPQEPEEVHDCPDGFFWEKKTKDCTGECHCAAQEMCRSDGSCIPLCAAGWTGPQCQESCPDDWYGNNCEGKCHCGGLKCHRETGHCLDVCLDGSPKENCINADLGELSAERTRAFTGAEWVGITTGAMFLLLLVMGVMFGVLHKTGVINLNDMLGGMKGKSSDAGRNQTQSNAENDFASLSAYSVSSQSQYSSGMEDVSPAMKTRRKKGFKDRLKTETTDVSEA